MIACKICATLYTIYMTLVLAAAAATLAAAAATAAALAATAATSAALAVARTAAASVSATTSATTITTFWRTAFEAIGSTSKIVCTAAGASPISWTDFIFATLDSLASLATALVALTTFFSGR